MIIIGNNNFHWTGNEKLSFILTYESKVKIRNGHYLDLIATILWQITSDQ